MQQVIINLVMNGIQSMENGGRLTIETAVESKSPPGQTRSPEKYLAIRVRDEGCGISADDREHIFDPFFTTKEVGSGTGLGLSISYGIVSEHGGWIEVESEPGTGACFSVYLPIEVAL